MNIQLTRTYQKVLLLTVGSFLATGAYAAQLIANPAHIDQIGDIRGKAAALNEQSKGASDAKLKQLDQEALKLINQLRGLGYSHLFPTFTPTSRSVQFGGATAGAAIPRPEGATPRTTPPKLMPQAAEPRPDMAKTPGTPGLAKAPGQMTPPTPRTGEKKSMEMARAKPAIVVRKANLWIDQSQGVGVKQAQLNQPFGISMHLKNTGNAAHSGQFKVTLGCEPKASCQTLVNNAVAPAIQPDKTQSMSLPQAFKITAPGTYKITATLVPAPAGRPLAGLTKSWSKSITIRSIKPEMVRKAPAMAPSAQKPPVVRPQAADEAPAPAPASPTTIRKMPRPSAQ